MHGETVGDALKHVRGRRWTALAGLLAVLLSTSVLSLSAAASTRPAFTAAASDVAQSTGGTDNLISINLTGSNLTGVTSTPVPLSPGFTRQDTDYVWYCDNGVNNLTLTLTSQGTISYGGSSGKALQVGVAVTNNQAVEIGAPDGTDYWIRCLPAGFPHAAVSKIDKAKAAYYVTGSFSNKRYLGYPIIFNRLGTPIWYVNGIPASAQDVELVPNTHTLAWASNVNPDSSSTSKGYYTLYNLDNQTVTYQAPVVDGFDGHEYFVDQSGNHWMISTPLASGYNIPKYPGTHDIINCVVQEISPSGNLLWSWTANQHVSPTESNSLAGQSQHLGVLAYDAYHCNSIDVDPLNANNILVSMRHIGVVLIDKSTGNIVWKLGGHGPTMDSEPILAIVGDPEHDIYGQHDARFEPNGIISLFDDHSKLNRAARGVEYAVNTVANTANMVWEYAAPSGASSNAMGSTRRYDSNLNTYDVVGSSYAGPFETVINWGHGAPLAGFSVVNNNGNLLFDLTFPKGVSSNRTEAVSLSALDLQELHGSAGTKLPSSPP